MFSAQPQQSRYCHQCAKAHKACICHLIESIPCQIPVLILQHPSEVKQAIGTARIAHLSLPQCEIYVGEDFSNHEILNQRLQDPSFNYLLLYPHETALPLTQSIALPQHQSKKLALIVLDGTWKKAFKIWSLSTNLHHLPKVTLDRFEQGNYQIRKSPKKHGLSTIEAIYYALNTLNPSQDRYAPLLKTFHAMIQFQIQQMPADIYQAHYQTHLPNFKDEIEA